MDYASNQNLYKFISRSHLSEKTTLYLFIQLVDAIFYMHKQKLLCHRDLKPENFLIDHNYEV